MKKGINTNLDVEVKSNLAKKIIIIVLCLTLMFFIIYPVTVFSGDENHLKTQTATERTVYTTADATGFVVRKEQLVSNSAPGTVIPLVKNGNKVALGDTVANVYSDGSAAENAARMEELQTEIDYYTSISANKGNTLQADIELYKKSVSESLYSLSDAIEDNNLSGLYDLSRNFRETLTKKQIAMGKKPDVSGILRELTAEYEMLKSSFSLSSSIKADASGYYVSSADGYEGTVDFDSVMELDSEAVDSIIASSPKSIPSGNVGKLITDFNWYLVFNTSRALIGEIAADSYVTVTIAGSPVGDIKMKVEAINQNEGSDTVTLVLSSNTMNEDVAQLRIVSVKLRTASFTGLAVDNQALRTVDGVKGVYIRVGNIIRFKKINPVYNDENMLLSSAPEGERGYVELYDEIILEGTELYDSKLVDR